MQQRPRSRQHARRRWWWCLAAISSLGVASVRAQTAPDAGALLRENQRDAPAPAARTPAPLPAAPAPAPPLDASPRLTVTAFQLEGARLLPEAELQAALTPWLGRQIGFIDLLRAADALVATYRRHGFLARAQLPPQDIDAGVVRIDLIEARLGSVALDPVGAATRIRPGVVLGTVLARQQPGAPLDADALDRASALLNDTPGLQAALSLAPGSARGDTDLRVSARDAPLWTGLVQVDDQGTRATGTARLGAVLSLDDPRGLGDQAVLATSASEGSRYARLAYSLPWGADGLRIGVDGSLMHYRLLAGFSALDATGDARTAALTAQYPIARGLLRNVTVQATLEHRAYRDFASGAQTDRKRLSALMLAMRVDLPDGPGDAGGTYSGIDLTAGRVDLSGDSANAAADRAGPDSQGGFGKLGWHLGRAQGVAPGTLLWLSLSGQVATRNLDSSEKFSLGGPNGVRAYPALEGQGDTGLLATLELRQSFAAAWQAIGFFDGGAVRRNHDPAYPGAPANNGGQLMGVGAGLAYARAGDFSLKATLATRIGSNPFANPDGSNSDASRGHLRAWLVAVMYF